MKTSIKLASKQFYAFWFKVCGLLWLSAIFWGLLNVSKAAYFKSATFWSFAAYIVGFVVWNALFVGIEDVEQAGNKIIR